MSSSTMSRLAVLLHAVLAMSALYYVTRVANFTPLSELPNSDTLAFGATALPPLVAGTVGRWVVGGAQSARLLAAGLGLAAVSYAIAFAVVLLSDEPLAPLLLILLSLWLVAGYAVLLAVVWLVGRAEERAD